MLVTTTTMFFPHQPLGMNGCSCSCGITKELKDLRYGEKVQDATALTLQSKSNEDNKSTLISSLV
jgi:hypothetical protein